jgi:UDP-N-acetylmuramate--alanine ligase
MKEYDYIYFLGIGGIGMSALARYFKSQGKFVCGYDKTPTALTAELIFEGIEIHFEENVNLLPIKFIEAIHNDRAKVLIILTPAVPTNHSEYSFFMGLGLTIKKRAEILGLVTSAVNTIAVAGTHGKTTTSSLITHILKTANFDPSAFLGGITKNYNSNFLLSANKLAATAKDAIIVVEADEYDRSFLTLFPETTLITSVDADHLDIYGDETHVIETFNLFANQCKQNLIIKESIAAKFNTTKKITTYSITNTTANFYAKNITINDGNYYFDIVTPSNTITKCTIGLPGMHNVENAVGATAVAVAAGVDVETIKLSLASFTGVKRRFDYQIRRKDFVYIDDYAHHPEELKATINSVREMYPGKKITGIFQPHLFTRTRDFADGFASSLDLLDECILLEIYPARELPIEGVNSKMLLDKMNIANKYICSKDDLLSKLKQNKLEVLLTLGAGDIDNFVEPITKLFDVK